MKDLSLHILDIVQNSLRAGADRIDICIDIEHDSDSYTLLIKDNGSGMDDFTTERVSDPFFTTRKTRKIGLGIPLLKQNTERTGGIFEIESKPGTGTSILAKSVLSHIDLLPEGDLGGVVSLLISANPAIRFNFSYSAAGAEYKLDTDEIKEILGEVPVNDPEIRNFLGLMISENIQQLKSENKFA